MGTTNLNDIPLGGTFWQHRATKAVVEVKDRVQDSETDETVLIHMEVPGTGFIPYVERRSTPLSQFLKLYDRVEKTYGWEKINDRTDRQPVLQSRTPSRPSR